MKLILSRKGFDSGYGGCASPIFKDDSMVSLPIPFPGGKHLLCEVTNMNRNCSAGDLVDDLTHRRQESCRHSRTARVHLDPYLKQYRASTSTGWRPAFGQDGAAQSHLRNEGVGVGDLFLFFGWFRRVEQLEGKDNKDTWRFVPRSADLQVMFGWLQIGEILDIDGLSALDAEHAWLKDHPHWKQRKLMGGGNTIYVSTGRLVIDRKDLGPGGGTFDSFRSCLQLTDPEQGLRSVWRLPSWFHPTGTGPLLSCHRDPARWSTPDAAKSTVRLLSVPIGQEFVLDLDNVNRQEALVWLASLFAPMSVGGPAPQG